MKYQQAKKKQTEAGSTRFDQSWLKRWLRGATVVGAVVLVSLGFGWLLDPSTLPITQVRVEGEFRHLTPEVLEKLVSSEVRDGFFSIDILAVQGALLSEPWVDDVSVTRVWPDKLQVTVSEQQPFAYWGDVGLLNVNGVPFYPEPETFPHDLVQLDGPVGSELLVMDRYLTVDALLGHQSARVAEMNLSERRAWSFQLSNGTKVLLGQSDFDSRLQRFAGAFRGFLAERLHVLATVDLRYPNGFALEHRNTVDDSV